MRLKIKSGDLSCRVSATLYNTSAPDSPADPPKFIENWSMEKWKTVMGAAYSTADFTNDRLAKFSDGYPVRLADMDFTIGDKNFSLHGHSRIALSVRGARFGYVNCMVMGESAEQTARMWAPLADKAECVVNSFVLDAP